MIDRRAALIFAIVALGRPQPAHAQTGIVIPAGSADEDLTDAGVASTVAELERLGWARAAIPRGRVVGTRLASPSQSEIDGARADLEEGLRAWFAGELDRADDQLERGLARADAQPAAVIRSARLRNLVFRAEVALALVADRQGRAEAARARLQALASRFTNRPVDRASFGPRAAELYAEVDTPTMVTLTVEAPFADAIYVDYQRVGSSDLARIRVPAGDHTIYASIDGELAYRATINLSEDHTRAVLDPPVSQALRFGDSADRFVGVVGLRGTQLGRAAELFAAEHAAPAVIVVHRSAGRISVRRFDPRGRLRKTGTIAADATGGAVRALARRIAGGADFDSADQPPSVAAPTALAVAGGAAVIAGLILVAMDGRGTCSQGTCPDVYDTDGVGVVSLSAGVVMATSGLIWRYLRTERASSSDADPR